MACKGGTLQCGDTKYYPNAYYKVGDLFLTTNSENPSVRFGGEWELFGKGKTLVCIDEEDVDFSTVKKTGGEKNHTLTVDEIPSHNHDIKATQNATGFGDGWPAAANYAGTTDVFDSPIQYAGKGLSHNNIQPYITCYIWIRTK